MLRQLDRYPRFKKVVHIVLLAAFMSMPIQLTAINAYAVGGQLPETKRVFMHDVEDPRLKVLIRELLDVIKVLWKMLWSFQWVKHPVKFYKALKKVFVVWFQLMSELFKVLWEYIVELENEVDGIYCDTRDCQPPGGKKGGKGSFVPLKGGPKSPK